MDGFAKSTVLVLAGSMALGMVPGDDDSAFRDLRQDGFAIVGSTASTATNSGGDSGLAVQDNITGELLAGPNYVTGVVLTDPSSGSNASA